MDLLLMWKDLSQTNMTIHAPDTITGGEYTLCGIAFDAYESGDSDELIVFVQPFETITCEQCRTAIKYVRDNFRWYQYRPVD